MNTLQQFAEERLQVPLRVAWYLSDLVRARGVQDLFIKEVESACPGVCRDMVRKVLKDMKHRVTEVE